MTKFFEKAGAFLAEILPWGINEQKKLDEESVRDYLASGVATAVTCDSAESLGDSEIQIDTICVLSGDNIKTLLTENLMKILRKHMVVADQNKNFWLKFSTGKQGCTLDMMVDSLKNCQSKVLAVQTSDGDIFGSYTNVPWAFCDEPFGNRKAFLWRTSVDKTSVEVFKCSNNTQGTTQVLCKQFLTVGNAAEHGLKLHDILLGHGFSEPTKTFPSPSLPQNGKDIFDAHTVEAWVLTPHSNEDSAAALQSQLDFHCKHHRFTFN